MIELGGVSIRDHVLLNESRQLLLLLTKQLHLSDIRATQIVMLVSEIATQGLLQHSPLQCDIGLLSEKPQRFLSLTLSAIKLNKLTEHLPLNSVFSSYSFTKQQSEHDTKASLTGKIILHSQSLNFDEYFIAKQRKHFEIIKAIDVQNELKNNPHAIIQREKLSALGTFVAGTAHELNNPMMGILNYLQYSLKHIESADKCIPALKKAENETLRCIQIVKDLLRYSRNDSGGMEEFEPYDIKLLWQEIFALQKYRIKHEKIEIIIDAPESLPLIPIRVNNIGQVFANILTNAFDAMAESNTKKISIRISTNIKQCVIDITDTGCGIAPDILYQIYTPFFTTKKPGKGTGLGMSICRRIIEEHQGSLEISSDLYQGATVHIALPLKQFNQGMTND